MDQASSFIPQPPTETSGPEFYNYRRALWLNAIPSPDFDPSIVRPRVYPQPPSSSITRLQSILTGDNVEEDEHLWENYLSKVFDSLVGGQRLRRGLGLSWVIKILQAGWLRDGTWQGLPSSGATTNTSDATIANSVITTHLSLQQNMPPHFYPPRSIMSTISHQIPEEALAAFGATSGSTTGSNVTTPSMELAEEETEDGRGEGG